MDDMVRAQSRLLDHLEIEKLYASVGASMGGMQSLAFGVHFPSRVGKIVSISGCARSHPYSIAMRHTQRQVLMMDPNWNRGFYYDAISWGGPWTQQLPIRSLVGLIPLYAVLTLEPELINKFPNFKRRMDWFIQNRHDVAERNIASMRKRGKDERLLLSL
ncbi:MAG: hypothetical protein M1823_007306, partial [Watsoniomyces obsoletus]